MKVLVLGGSAFLSRAVVEEAVRRGHEVTAACRGVTGPVPEGCTHLAWDRTRPPPSELAGAAFDLVVDVGRHPTRVRAAVEAVPDAHWVFVSTINVYPDTDVPGGTPDTLALHEPVHTDDEASSPEIYGAMKVGCEQAVRDRAASWTIVRPGLIIGPGDPSGRFSYWASRLGDADPGEEVLAPGEPTDLVQVIDARDLAAWIVDLGQERVSGIFDASGHAVGRGELLSAAARGVDADVSWTWVPQDFLVEHSVEPWMGPRSVPLWLPVPAYAGLLTHVMDASYAAGLRTRPVEESARDTLAWLRATADATVTGLTRAEEREVLAAWHAR